MLHDQSSGTENDIFENQSYTRTHNLIRWKSGKRVDPRLLALLEAFGEIYISHRDLFKKMFEEEYEDLFKKIGDALKKRKQMKRARSMSRSLSMRSVNGETGFDEEEIEELRLERFKVKPPKVIVVGEDGTSQGGQDQTT